MTAGVDVAQGSEEPTRHGAGRVIALVVGAILALIALGLTLAGVALIIGQAVMDEDGFVTSSSKELSTATYALASPTFDVSEMDEWPFDDDPIRLRLTADGEQELFIGVAPAAEANDVLDGIEHEVVEEGGRSDWWGDDVDTERRDGDAPSGAPEDLLDWAVSARGTDDVAVTWEPTDGEWVVIAMRADGSAGVELDAKVGADVPYLQGIAWVIALSGIALGLVAAALISFGAHRRDAVTGAVVTRDAGAGTGAGTGGVVMTDATGATTALGVPAPPNASPTRLHATMEEPLSRWLWIVKWLLLIPHYIVLAFLAAAFVVTTIVAWFAIVFTGRFPRGLFDFNLGVLRWSWRVNAYSYGALSTDRYPPFSLGEQPDYPARLTIDYPARLSHGLPFVKWVLALPHLLLLGAVSGGVVIGSTDTDAGTELGVIGLLILILGIGLLFTGRMQRGVFDLVVGIQRWSYRTIAYLALMTDVYPPFRLDQGGEDPGDMES